MADIETLRSLDRFSDVREYLKAVGRKADEWAGIPLPIDGEELVIDKSYVFADLLNKQEKEDNKPTNGFKIRNSFWSRRHRRYVAICEDDKNGIFPVWFPGIGSLDQQIKTLGCSMAWGIEQEAEAIQTLAGLLHHHAFKCYMLTGSFLESSKKSGVMYMFRKLRPTIAVRAHISDENMTKVLCTLCMHPIGYYQDSWAGAMTPTDDVIAHLMLMRGDEHMFWKRCNQHAPDRPESGL